MLSTPGYNVEGEGSVMLGSWTRGEHYMQNIIEVSKNQTLNILSA